VLTRSLRGFAAALLVGMTVLGCAAPVINPRLAAYDGAGYRYANVRRDAGEEDLFIILAFSGGGTRAAAFSYGVIEGLESVRYHPTTGPERTLLDDVDVISSVSGGSFTAAHYALFGKKGFKQFEDSFLYRNIQGDLVARALAPWNWPRLSPLPCTTTRVALVTTIPSPSGSRTGSTLRISPAGSRWRGI